MTRRLAQALITEGILQTAQVEDALQRQVLYGGSLDTNLLEAEVISEEDLLRALGAAHSLPTAGVAEIDAIANHIPRLFPLPFAETYHLVPRHLDGNVLEVLVQGRPDEQLFERIHERLHLELRPAVTTEVRLHYAMSRIYGLTLLPRFHALLTKLGTEPATPAGAVGDSKVLSWGVSSAHVQPTRTRGFRERKGLDMRGLLKRTDSATDRDTVVEILLGAAIACFDFSAIFLVQGDTISGWRGANPESTQRIAQIALPVELPSVFQTIYATRGHYLGPLPNNSVNSKLLADLGREVPRAAFVAPIMVGDRLAAILFSDNGPRAIPPRRVAAMLVLVQRCGNALERLIRRRRAAAERALEHPEQRADEVPARFEDEEHDVVELEDHEFEVVAHDAGTEAEHVLLDTDGPVVVTHAGPPPSTEAEQAALTEMGVSAPIEPDDEQEEPWEEVSFADMDMSEAADQTAFTSAIADSAPEPDHDDGYVAFSDVDEGAEESLGEWGDVLMDAAAAAEASAVPEEQPAAQPTQYTVSWDQVIAETQRAANLVPREAPKEVEVAGTMFSQEELLLDSLDASDPQTRHDAVEALLKVGTSVDNTLADRFPGKISFDPLAAGARLPPFTKINGILELLAARGVSAASIVLPYLEDNDPRKRFFAIYFLLTVHYPPAIEVLSRRLYDSAPRNRHLAADALRRYAREPAYQRVIDAVRAQLKVPVLENQVSAVQVLGQLRDPSAVPSLIPLVAAPDAALVQAATSALAVLCTQDFGQDVAKWSQWWHDNYSAPRPTWLLESLRHDNVEMRRIANTELQLLTGRTANFNADDPPEEREKTAKLWDAWWQQITAAQAQAAAPQA